MDFDTLRRLAVLLAPLGAAVAFGFLSIIMAGIFIFGRYFA